MPPGQVITRLLVAPNKNMNVINTIVISCCFSSIACTKLLATLPLITNPGSGNLITESGGYLVGAAFDVGAFPLQVSALGLFDAGAPGFAQVHSVGLWTEGGTLLARVDIPPEPIGLTGDEYVYHALDKFILLQAGRRFIIGTHYPDPIIDSFFDSRTHRETWSPYATYYNTRYAPAEEFGLPWINGGGFFYVGPNAQFTVIPEPANVALFLSALVFMAACLFRLRSDRRTCRTTRCTQ